MIETIEERLQDLERLVLKQSERIDALESQLETAQRIAALRVARAVGAADKDAA